MELLTTREAAELAGMETPAFRILVSHARHRHGFELQAPPDLWPDKRTPMYAPERLSEYLASRRLKG